MFGCINTIGTLYCEKMVKTEIDGTLGGIEFRLIKYHKNDNPRQDLGEFVDDSDRLKQEMGVEDKGIGINLGGLNQS